MKKVFVILLCIIALLFVACELDELKTPDGESTPSQGDGGGGSGDGGGQSGEGGGGSQGSGGAEDASADSGSGSGPVQSDYKVGDIGPAGGYIFYDRGYYENGWRYLEAAPADMKVINGVPTVDATSDAYASADADVLFGYYRLTDDGDDVYVNGTTTWDPTNCTGFGIGDGIRNTQLLLDAMGDTAYVEHIYTFNGNHGAKSAVYAAKMVDLLTVKVGDNTYSDWFIPSLGELKQMYDNLYQKGLGGFNSYTYASSSECDIKNYSQNTDLMKAMSFSTGAFDQVVFRGSVIIHPARAF